MSGILEKQILGREGVMRDNNIIINVTGTVYSVQCVTYGTAAGSGKQ
jgi:hypothetical protein